jgi:glycosyltransferase involved in cell wall biosynthesis
MCAADAFILPTFYEQWPLVGLEALASGTPILMTSIGGIKEYLVDGENGFFIKRDSQDIADKVRKLIDNPKKIELMKINARETALGYSWQSVTQQYINLIKTVVKEKVE